MAITGTIKGNVLTVTAPTKDDTAIDLVYSSYDEATVPSAEGEKLTFGSNVKTIVASSTKASITLGDNFNESKVTSIAGGKGNDVFSTSKDITISGGAGNDLFVAEGGTGATLTVADYTVGQDSIQVGELESLDDLGFKTIGKNVILSYGSNNINIKGGKDKQITIIQGENVVGQQSFQASKENEEEYAADDKNTGAVLRTKANYVDAGSRSKVLEYQLTGQKQLVDGGKGDDTFKPIGGTEPEDPEEEAVYQITTIAGGKGNDTFVVNKYTRTIITDYTKNGKELIQLGDDVAYAGYYVKNGDVYLMFKEGSSSASKDDESHDPSDKDVIATVRIVNGVWDQITKKANNIIEIVGEDGKSIFNEPRAFDEPGVRYITSLNAKNPNSYDLGDEDLKEITGAKDTEKFIIDSKTYDAIIFTPKVNVSLQAGGGYQTISGGAGNDTILGENKEITITGGEDADKVGLLTSDDVEYVTFKQGGGATEGVLSYTLTFNATLDGGAVSFDVVLEEDPDKKYVFYVTKVGDTDGGEENISIEGGEYVLNVSSEFWDKGYSVASSSDLEKNGEIFVEVLTGGGDGGGITYNYVYNANKTRIYGGAGNDVLVAQLSGGSFDGGAGVDTLYGGKGKTQLTGGEGNDVFVLDGRAGLDKREINVEETDNGENGIVYKAEDKDHVNASTTIRDFYAGTDAATKKTYGTDKIVVSWDKFNSNNNNLAARASVISGSFDAVNSLLRLEVGGQSWGTGEEADGDEGTTAATAVGFNNSYTTGTYYVKIKEGETLAFTEKGITYNQKMGAADSGKVTVTNENYLGIIDPDAEKIDASSSKSKGVQIVAGVNTKEIIGGTKADTLVGNGGVANDDGYVKDTLKGGAGNDIFVVKSGEDEITANGMGEFIEDYSEKGPDGADKVQVTNLEKLNNKVAEAVNVEAKNVTVTFTGRDPSAVVIEFGVVDEDGEVVANGDRATISGEYNADDNSFTFTSDKDDIYVEIEEEEGREYTFGFLGKTFEFTGDDYAACAKEVIEASSNSYKDTVERTFTNGINGDDVNIGGIELKSAKGKAITFQQVDEVVNFKADGTVNGSKNVTKTMIRTFGDDEEVKGGKSDYLEVFDNIDKAVKIISAGTVATKIVNNGNSVVAINGGGKVDTIYTGSNDEGDVISVKSGGGNDVIAWDGTNDVYITDFTASKFANKGGKITQSAGDNLIFTTGDMQQAYKDMYEGKGDNGGAVGKMSLSWDADDVVLTYQVDKSKPASLKHTLTFKGAKGSSIAIASEESLIGEKSATINVTNPHEYLLASSENEFNKSKVLVESDAKDVEHLGNNDETWIVNAAAVKKALSIDLREIQGNEVGTVYGGTAADTVYASSALQRADLGAGNDVIYTGGADDLKIATGAGNDIVVVQENTNDVTISDYTVIADKLHFADDVYITGVTSKKNDGQLVIGSGNKAKTVDAYDYTINLSNNKTIVLKNLVENSKITRVDDADNVAFTAAKAHYYSLDYVSDNTITLGASDYYNGAVVDLTGIESTEVEIEAKAKNAAVKGLANGSKVSVGKDNGGKLGKNPVTFYGNTYDDGEVGEAPGANYIGSAGNDVYYGGGAADEVKLGAGNDTVRQAKGSVVKATIEDTEGSNVYVAGKDDNYTIKYHEGDKIVFTDEKSYLTETEYNDNDGTLKLYYNADVAKVTENDSSASGTGVITITNYTSDKNVNFGYIVTDKNNKESIKDILTQPFGDPTLKLDGSASAKIEVASAINPNVTTVVASSRTGKQAINIDASGNDKVTSIIGGAGADTLAIAATGSLTGGNGNDTFILKPSTLTSVTVTDFNAGTNKIELTLENNETYFDDLVDYDNRVSIEGSDVIIKDGNKTIKLNGAINKKVQIDKRVDGAATTTKIFDKAFSDPVNVKLVKGAVTDWVGTEENPSKFDATRVNTFDASATATEVKFTSGTNFSKFVGNSKDTTLTINENNEPSVAITVGGNTNTTATITLGIKETADTITYSKGNLIVNNFGKGDEIKGIAANKVKVTDGIGAEYDEANKVVTLTLTDNKKVNVSGTGVVKGTDADTGYKTITINGIGNFVYNKEEAAFEERFEELVGDFVATDDLSDITAVKAAVTTDNNFSTNNTVEFKLAASSALTNNKKQK